MNTSKFEFSLENVTIQDFYIEWHGKTDCNPISQRPPVKAEGSKKMKDKNRGIINSILQGLNIGQITLNELGENVHNYKYESVDGGHRKRAIKAFMDNKVESDWGFYNELDKDIKQAFLNYELQFAIYKKLTGRDVGYVFRTLNNTTPVTFMEELNSYGDAGVANAVRKVVRHMDCFPKDETHAIFDWYKHWQKGEEKIRFPNFTPATNNDGLNLEEIIARYFYMIWKGKLCKADDKRLRDMYASDLNHDTTNLDKISKKLNRILDLVLDMHNELKRQGHGRGGMKKARFNLYFRICFSLLAKGEFKWTDDGCQELVDALWNYEKSYEPASNHHPKDGWDTSPFNKNYNVLEQWKKCLNEFKHSDESVRYCVDRLEVHDINLEDYVVRLDSKRTFNSTEKELVLNNQGGVCAIDGEPLYLEDSEGAHVIAHADGGETVMDNLWVVRKEHNSKMGTMDAREYKQLWLSQQRKSA